MPHLRSHLVYGGIALGKKLKKQPQKNSFYSTKAAILVWIDKDNFLFKKLLFSYLKKTSRILVVIFLKKRLNKRFFLSFVAGQMPRTFVLSIRDNGGEQIKSGKD